MNENNRYAFRLVLAVFLKEAALAKNNAKAFNEAEDKIVKFVDNLLNVEMENFLSGYADEKRRS